LLRDPSAGWDYPAVSCNDFSEFSIRTEKWRYTVYIDGSEELYDHVKDPEEWTNLAEDTQYEGIKQDLRLVLSTVKAIQWTLYHYGKKSLPSTVEATLVFV